MNRLTLNHVVIWKRDGWKPITAQEASAKHPGGKVSAISGLFRCNLCGQYVALSKNGHFRHSRGYDDKRCPERLKSLNTVIYTAISKPDTLPIRMQILSSSYFLLEIGLILPPEMEDNTQKIKIISSGVPDKLFIYDLSRLSSEKITYLSVGNRISSEYQLYNEDGTTNEFFPDKIQGIYSEGTLFDGNTQKRLPDGADVTAETEYYLLSRKELPEHSADMQIQLICRQNQWHVHQVKALKYNENTAKFFLHYGYGLTQKPVSVVPVWPEYVNKPYIIHHIEDTITFFLVGQQVKPELFPAAQVKVYSETEQHMIFDVVCQSRQQLLSASRNRFQILRYTYLWKSELNQSKEIPEIDVTGTDNTYIDGSNLPEDKTIRIKAKFDGFVTISEKQRIIDKYELSAGNILEIDHLKRGYIIQIFQGMDCVKTITFQKKSVYQNQQNEEKILHILKRYRGEVIPVPHHLGAMAAALQAYPKIKQWIYQKIRQGYIYEKAYKYLINTVKELQT